MKKCVRIECEGTDGAGKTTALKYLVEKLQNSGSSVLETREVGSPLVPINVKLRELVLSPESRLSGEAMEMIFGAMRFEHDKLLKSVSSEYDFVVSDRGWLSHLAYTDHNVNKEFTEGLYLNFLKDLTQLPDVVIYFSINTETGLKRRINRGEGMDAIEQKGIEFQELVRGSFENYIENLNTIAPGATVFVVDANQDIPGVQAQIDNIISALKAVEKPKVTGITQ